MPNNSCYNEASPSLCKTFLSDRFTHMPFVTFQQFSSGIPDFIFILIVGLIIESFRCSPFYRGFSVIHLKETPDPGPPFRCFYYHQRGTTPAVKLAKVTDPIPRGFNHPHCKYHLGDAKLVFKCDTSFSVLKLSNSDWANSYYMPIPLVFLQTLCCLSYYSTWSPFKLSFPLLPLSHWYPHTRTLSCTPFLTQWVRIRPLHHTVTPLILLFSSLLSGKPGQWYWNILWDDLFLQML